MALSDKEVLVGRVVLDVVVEIPEEDVESMGRHSRLAHYINEQSADAKLHIRLPTGKLVEAYVANVSKIDLENSENVG